MKVCTKCGRELPENMFCKSKREPDGLQRYCKECRAKYQRSNYKKKSEMKTEIDNLLNQIKELQGRKESGLSDYTPRQLMEELRRRGYKGTLTYVQTIDIEKI